MLFSRRPSITPLEAAAALAEGALVLVDVRTHAELRGGRVRGARHIPLAQLGARLGELDGERRVAFLCHSGARSARAASVARRAGLDAVNTRGGIIGWRRAGLPLERD